jgi:hypothetical protein
MNHQRRTPVAELSYYRQKEAEYRELAAKTMFTILQVNHTRKAEMFRELAEREEANA